MPLVQNEYDTCTVLAYSVTWDAGLIKHHFDLLYSSLRPCLSSQKGGVDQLTMAIPFPPHFSWIWRSPFETQEKEKKSHCIPFCLSILGKKEISIAIPRVNPLQCSVKYVKSNIIFFWIGKLLPALMCDLYFKGFITSCILSCESLSCLCVMTWACHTHWRHLG